MGPKRPTPRRTDSSTSLNVGVESAMLDGDSLSQDQMYRRNNFPLPARPPDGFDVVIPGRAPRRVDLANMAALREVEVDMVLECAGNGRTLMDPVPDGTPWGLGAVSPISVVGVRLIDVLGSLPESISSVVFTGADEGLVPIEGRQPYQFSISRELAESTLPILATHINREPLTIEHGAPVRLIVPGQYAMKSVKWLTRIEALEFPFQGHFVRKYRYYGDADEPEGSPVGEIAVRSLISNPLDGSSLRAGHLEIAGSAWSGAGRVTTVDVSIDEGAHWIEADLVSRISGGRFAPVHWAAAVDVEPGQVEIMARASDSSGATQPLEPRWNANGFANNVVQRVVVNLA